MIKLLFCALLILSRGATSSADKHLKGAVVKTLIRLEGSRENPKHCCKDPDILSCDFAIVSPSALGHANLRLPDGISVSFLNNGLNDPDTFHYGSKGADVYIFLNAQNGTMNGYANVGHLSYELEHCYGHGHVWKKFDVRRFEEVTHKDSLTPSKRSSHDKVSKTAFNMSRSDIQRSKEDSRKDSLMVSLSNRRIDHKDLMMASKRRSHGKVSTRKGDKISRSKSSHKDMMMDSLPKRHSQRRVSPKKANQVSKSDIKDRKEENHKDWVMASFFDGHRLRRINRRRAQRRRRRRHYVYSVKVYYTQEFADDTPNIEEFVNEAIRLTNIGYENSKLPIKVVNHCIEKANITDDSSLDDFRNMKSSVDELRGSADAALLLVLNMDYCGVAKIPEPVAKVKKECGLGYYSFGHELGHNFGLFHDKRVSDNPTYPYGHGHLIKSDDPVGFRTIMAYPTRGHWLRVNYYSNPRVIYSESGTPTGVRGVSNNARVLMRNIARFSRRGDESEPCKRRN